MRNALLILVSIFFATFGVKLPQANLPAEVPWSTEGLKWNYFQEVLHIDYYGKDPLALTWSEVHYKLVDTLSLQNKMPGCGEWNGI